MNDLRCIYCDAKGERCQRSKRGGARGLCTRHYKLFFRMTPAQRAAEIAAGRASDSGRAKVKAEMTRFIQAKIAAAKVEL